MAITSGYVICQQQDIYKIRDGVRGHGRQRVMAVTLSDVRRCRRAVLACGCKILVDWLPLREQPSAVVYV